MTFELLESRKLLSATLTGKITYTLDASRYANSVAAPIALSGAHITFDVRTNPPGQPGTSVFFGDAYTDATGTYHLTSLPPGSYANDTITVSVIAESILSIQSGRPAIREYRVVQQGSNDSARFVTTIQNTSAIGVVTSAEDKVVTFSYNLTAADTGSANLVEEFDIFEALGYGNRYYTSTLGGVDNHGVVAVFMPTVMEGLNQPGQSSYQGGVIRIANQSEPARFWETTLHEYGHYIANLNGFLGASNIEDHSLESNLRNAAALTDRIRTLAWNEGFADYFSIRSMVVMDAASTNLAALPRADSPKYFGDLGDDLSKPFTSDGGEDSEASVAGILYQLASSRDGLVGGDIGLFNLLKAFQVTTLQFFFDLRVPVDPQKRDEWAAVFQANDVTPLDLQSQFVNGLPTFTFEIPKVVLPGNGLVTNLGGDAFNAFRIDFYDPAGNLIASTSDFGVGSSGYQLLPPRTKQYLSFDNAEMNYGQYTISAALLKEISQTSPDEIVWTVAAAWVTPGAPPPAFGGSAATFFPPLHGLPIPQNNTSGAPQPFNLSVLGVLNTDAPPSDSLVISVDAVDCIGQQPNYPTAGEIESVSFYVSSDGDIQSTQGVQDNATLLGSAEYNPLWHDWELTVDCPSDLFDGSNVSFYAVATDQAGVESDPIKESFVPLVSFNPNDGLVEWWRGAYTLASNDDSGGNSATLTASTAIVSGSAFEQSTTLTASGFASPDDSAVHSVAFYTVAPNGLGPCIGVVGQADGNGNWNLTFDTTGASTTVEYLAVATYANGLQSVPASDTVAFTPPTLADTTATASSDSSSGAAVVNLTVSASAASDDSVQNVAFYQDTTGMGPGNPDAATDTLLGNATYGSDGWTLTVNASSLSGADVFYAVATDTNGFTSEPAFARLSPDPAPSIGSFTSLMDRYTAGYSLVLSAAQVSTADGGMGTVTFYRDTSGTGIYNPNTVQALGNGSDDGDGWSLSADTTSFVGPQTFFAVVTDDQGVSSSPVSLTVAQDAAVSVDGLSAAPSMWNGSGQVLALNLSAGTFGDAASVQFYSSSDGSFANAEYLGMGTQTDNGWTLNDTLGSGTGSTETFFAVAIDSSGLTTDPTSLTIGPATIGQLQVTPGTSSSSPELTLSAGGIIDWSSPVTSVSFYQDTSGTGVFNSATATARRYGRSTESLFLAC